MRVRLVIVLFCIAFLSSCDTVNESYVGNSTDYSDTLETSTAQTTISETIIETTMALPNDSTVYWKDLTVEKAVREILELDEDAPIKISDLSEITELKISPKLGTVKKIDDLVYFENLEVLNLYGHEIYDLSPLSKLSNLRVIYFADNYISDLSPLREIYSLREIYISFNEIADISPLENLSELETLYLEGNFISDLSPISSLTNLKFVNLDGNNISNVAPLSGLTNLLSLSLNNNKISDVSPLQNYKKEMFGLLLLGNNISDWSYLDYLGKAVVGHPANEEKAEDTETTDETESET